MPAFEIESHDPFWQNDTRLEDAKAELAEIDDAISDIDTEHEATHEPSPMQLDAFKAYCSANVSCSPDGNHCSLTIKADANGRTYERTIDLAPIVEFFGRKIREAHLNLHGNDPVVAGWRDWISQAGKVARRVAENEGVRSVFKEAAKSAIPGLGLAMKAHDVLVKAKDGDPASLDKLSAIKAKAEAGDPKASQALTTLRVMNEAIKIKEDKSPTPNMLDTSNWIPTGPGTGWVKDRWGGAPLQLSGVATGMYAVGISTEVGKKRKGRHTRLKGPLADRYTSRANPHRKGTGTREELDPSEIGPDGIPLRHVMPPSDQEQTTPFARLTRNAEQQSQMSQSYDGGYDGGYDDGGYDDSYDDFDDIDAAIGGWLFNHPYRSVLETVSSPFPGAGVAARALYNQGLNTSNKTEDKLTAFFRKAFRVPG